MKHADRAPAAGFDRRGKSNAPRALSPAERRRIERLVGHLLELLDEADGDPDLEPSLGWSSTHATTRFDQTGHLIDLEEEHDGREPRLVPARLDVAHRSNGRAGALIPQADQMAP